jgi:hypothetical protein
MKQKPAPKKLVKKAPSKSSVAVVSRPSNAQEAKWQAEDDVRTLQRAGEIERDKARLAKAQAMAKKQADDLARITGKKK